MASLGLTGTHARPRGGRVTQGLAPAARSLPEDPGRMRPMVARSWHRSLAAGVDRMDDRGFLDSGRVDDHTSAAAALHLAKLDEVVSDMGGYVSLTAPNGTLVRPSYLREGESFPEGYSLLEESCGSNGEGLALEEGRGVWLAPQEHYREDMRLNWCFASLVRDPFHDRVRAVIGLTFPAHRVSGIDPGSTLLMLESVASRIEKDIEVRSSSREKLLLKAYLKTSRRRGASCVVAMDGKHIMMNSVATEALADTDLSVVSGYAKAVMISGGSLVCDVVLQGMGDATLEVSPVHLSGTSTGAVVVLRARGHQAGSVSLPEWAASERYGVEDQAFAEFQGTSAEHQRTMRLARRAREHARSAAIVGEAGSGKRRIAEAITAGQGVLLHVDANDQKATGATIRDRMLCDDAGAPSTLLIEHIDALSPADAREVVGCVKSRPGTRVVCTMTRSTDATMIISEACDVLEIPVAPLRSRRDDIPLLAAAIAEESGGRKLSRKLVSTLTVCDWPRNIDQLRVVVSNAAESARGAEITVDDLPQGFHRVLTNGKLSRLEDAELRELRSALYEAQGNRRLAAEMLEIGRSTLYRRLDYFRGRGFDL